MNKKKCISVLCSTAAAVLMASVVSVGNVKAAVRSYVINNDGKFIRFNVDALLTDYTKKLTGGASPMFDEYMKDAGNLYAFEDDKKGLVSSSSVEEAYAKALVGNKTDFSVDNFTENASDTNILKNVNVGYEYKNGTIVSIDDSMPRATIEQAGSAILGKTIVVASLPSGVDAAKYNVSINGIKLTYDSSKGKFIGTIDGTYSISDLQAKVIVSNSSDNTAEKDVTPPVITLNGNFQVTIGLGEKYTEPGAVVTDNIDKDLTVTINGTVDSTKAGTYRITYDAVDKSGNKASEVVRTVVVEDKNLLKTYTSSDYFKSDYININIDDSEKLVATGRTKLDNISWWMQINDKNGSTVFNKINAVKDGGYYDGTFDLDTKLKDGDYKLTIYFKPKNNSHYTSYYWDIPLKVENGNITFPLSQVYDNNCTVYEKSSSVNPDNYLDIDVGSDTERNELQQLSNQIVEGAGSDYEKILKIHDWVTENIYYNFDAYYSGNYGETSAYGTYKNKTSVCQGYAELTNALARMAGIPCRVVSGHAIWLDSQSWETVDSNISSHAWNEAFVDGRWIIIDTTWDSFNKYENGQFEKGKTRHLYFDPALKSFSLDHKIIEAQ